MSDVLFSILIPSIPSRIEKFLIPLIAHLEAQIEVEGSVEVLCLIDNKTRSIGLKREALVQTAIGRYVAFVDDDDWVTDDYVKLILDATATDADCIVFDQKATLTPEIEGIIRHGIEFETTQCDVEKDPMATRKPWHVMAYKREIAQSCHFPDTSWGEDATWVDQAWPKIKTQHRIPLVLHHYRYDEAVSEAVLDE